MRGEEDRLQKLVIEYLEWAAPSVLVVPVPNHVHTNPRHVRILKSKRQLLPGATDTIWTWPGADGEARVAFVEFKSATGDLRNSQIDFRSAVLRRRAYWSVISKFDLEWIDALLEQFGVPEFRDKRTIKSPQSKDRGLSTTEGHTSSSNG